MDFGMLNLAMFKKNWAWFFIWGLILVLLGIIAVSAASMTTIVSVIFLGILMLIGGLVVIWNSFSFWWGQWGSFFLHIVMGILYTVVGIMLINHPVFSSLSLTWLLGIFFTVIGIFRIGYSVTRPNSTWGWILFNGIISLLLGILIISNWPSSSLYIIGLFVGIDLLFCGWTYILAALSARTMIK